MIKKLPFKYPPIIDCYSGLSSRCGVIECYNQVKPYIITNWMMMFTDNFNYSDGSFVGLDSGIEDDCFLEELILNKKWKDRFELDIIHCIDKNKYVLLGLDHYYIPHSTRYKKQHFYHDDAMILGYDLQKKIFFVSDNFIAGKLVILEVAFSDIKTARTHHKSDRFVEIVSRCFDKDKHHAFDLTLTKKLLNIYIKSEDPTQQLIAYGSVPKVDGGIYGLAIYPYLSTYIKRLAESKVPYDYRGFHVVCNHMSVMLLLLDYLKKEIDPNKIEIYRIKYQQLLSECIILRNLLIKAGISKTQILIEKILTKIDKIAYEEESMLQSLIKII
ncbi:hypothetical protein HZI73_05690 [Vallitalea pronyensis]|uniref:Uncharacterized protein n=1 Tax=Vallitalea pronyensis TaxID=1348613 RepID=A0A8J8MIE7_9FIRM|nr:hypothetical protein [Vallitalea pronyensis]QUI21818.1 hypothetical protein HZI73_05690 [Vallitalea pronyensis]